MRKIRTVVFRGAALAAMVLLMTGCIKLDMDLKVSSNNKVSGTVIVGFKTSLLSLTGQSASQVLQGSSLGVPASGAPGTSVAPYQDNQFTGETITYDKVDLSQFDQSSSSDSLKVERVGDEFHVSGALDFSNTGQNGSGGTLGPAAQQALSTAQLSVKLTFPGAVSSSNGQIAGNTVTWTPKIGEKTPLTAVAGAIGTGGSFPKWIIVAIAVVVLLGAAAVVMSRRRRAVVPAMPSEPAAAEPAAAEPAPAPAPAPETPTS